MTEATPQIILLDLMDTLVEDPYHRIFEGERPLVDLRYFLRWKERSSFEEFERGEISEAEFFDRYYKPDTPPEVLETLPSARKLKKQILKGARFVPGMQALWNRLGALSGVKLGIASNYSAWYPQILAHQQDLEKHADYLFFSCEMGVRKPAAEYFQVIYSSLLARHPALTPGHLFFADDREENVAGARAAGWASFKMGTAEALTVALDEFLGRST